MKDKMKELLASMKGESEKRPGEKIEAQFCVVFSFGKEDLGIQCAKKGNIDYNRTLSSFAGYAQLLLMAMPAEKRAVFLTHCLAELYVLMRNNSRPAAANPKAGGTAWN